MSQQIIQPISNGQQSIIDAGFETRPPMLEKGSYIQWPGKFLRYIESKREIGKYLKKPIVDGPYEMKTITIPGDSNVVPPREETRRIQTEDDLSANERKY